MTVNEIQSIDDFAAFLCTQLADKPKGTVGRLPDGDLVWILDGKVIGCWEGAAIEFAFPWDQSVLDAVKLKEINVWVRAPHFEWDVPGDDFEGDLSLTPFRQ